MNKKFFVVMLLIAAIVAPASAKKATKEYQRPSLHMVLLNTDEPTSEQTADLMPVVDKSWSNYTFPSVYNQFTIPFQSMNAGKPKGGMMELITKYRDPKSLSNLTLAQLTEIKELLAGKQYNADLKARVDAVAPEVAKQLVMKWFNITEDGKYDLNTIAKLACYSATQMAAGEAVNTDMGAQLTLMQSLMEPTIANSYVSFSKLGFYANEPVAAFVKNIAIAVAELSGNDMVILAGKAAAEVAYLASKEGYSAYTTTLLYRLKWNNDIYQALSAIMTMNPENSWEGTIDMEAFKKMNFELEYMGADKCSSVVMINHENRGSNKAELTRQTVHKNINKQLVRLQNQYEEFKPMMPIVQIDGKVMLADMGTKESVKENEAFDVLVGETNEKGIVKYRVIGTTKVLKGKDVIWDNEAAEDAALAADKAAMSGEDSAVLGTKVKAVKGAQVGYFVKRKKAKK